MMIRSLHHLFSLFFVFGKLGHHRRLEICPLLGTIIKLSKSIESISLVFSREASRPLTDELTNVYYLLWLHGCIPFLFCSPLYNLQSLSEIREIGYISYLSFPLRSIINWLRTPSLNRATETAASRTLHALSILVNSFTYIRIRSII
jgi:hypothetical protein